VRGARDARGDRARGRAGRSVPRRTGGELRAGDDAEDARFFPLGATPDEIAFRAHEQALADLRER
jgi:hypothetical protein